jgi:hypothetical protein
MYLAACWLPFFLEEEDAQDQEQKKVHIPKCSLHTILLKNVEGALYWRCPGCCMKMILLYY